MKKTNKTKYPKYPNGGQIGDFLGNYGKAIADTGLSALGMGDVINQDSYKGSSAKAFNTITNITGGLAKTAVPMIAGIAGGPTGGMIAQGIQGVGSQVNNQVLQDRQQNLMKMGGLNIYAEGGMPNSEVEKQENSIAPNGEFTQFNGPSHENGGIPTNLDNGEMVFSDRLKSGKKTFAQLNKSNNTNKEDKMLENDKSNRLQKLTAQLMKEAKLKQSIKLFQEQESLKQSKMDSYAKRIGLSGDKFPDGGKKGMSSYNPSDYQASFDRFNNTGAGLYDVASGGNTTNANVSANLKNLGLTPHPSINGLYTKEGHVLAPHPSQTGSYVNLGAINDPRFNGSSQQTSVQPNVNTSTFNVGQQVPQQINTTTIDVNKKPLQFNPNMTTNPNTGQTINPVTGANITPIVEQYSNGGFKKYPNGGLYGNQDRGAEQDQMLSELNNMNVQQAQRANAEQGMSSQGPNWSNIGKQAAIGIGSNIGNIYDLARGNKPEVQNYQRAAVSKVDPTSELRYNDQAFSSAKEDVKNASVGNSSTYIQNRKDLAINQMLANARIKSQYDNQNANIQNQANQFNTNIGMQEQNANAQNRAASRNLQGNALSNIGQNVMGQYRDYNMGQRDLDSLGLIQGQYPQGINNPALAAYYQKNIRR